MALIRKNSNLYLTLVRLRRNRLAVFGLVIMLLLVVVAVFAPWIAPYDYAAQNLSDAFEPPCA